MRRCLIALAFALAALPARADDDIVLRGMGSFFVGGRIAEVSGKPVKLKHATAIARPSPTCRRPCPARSSNVSADPSPSRDGSSIRSRQE